MKIKWNHLLSEDSYKNSLNYGTVVVNVSVTVLVLVYTELVIVATGQLTSALMLVSHPASISGLHPIGGPVWT
jgi:hypothetical protein